MGATTFLQLVSRRGPQKPERALELVFRAAMSAADLHVQGHHHLGLEPSSLTIHPDGRITTAWKYLPAVDAAYRPPEAWDDAEVYDEPAEVYSLGCVLYFLLTGAPPFGTDDTDGRLRRAHKAEPLPAVPGLPVDDQFVLQRMTAKIPEQRYERLRDLIAELAGRFHTPQREPVIWPWDEPIFELEPMPEVKTKAKPEAVTKFETWYGTNRKPWDAWNAQKGFSADRDTKLHFGKCVVNIPGSHRIGSLGTPWWKRWLLWSADDRLSIRFYLPLREESFWHDLRSVLARRQVRERAALVYIHGYNSDFRWAALRAAQLGSDLQVPGVTVFFSWPSHGTLRGYPADEATIDASEPYLEEFLTKMVQNSGAERVHVLAHSMGNRAVLRTVERIATTVAATLQVPFDQIVLAAPDVDTDSFKRLAQAYAKVAKGTTMYVSAKDLALASSGFLHDYPRAGLTPPVTVVSGIDTVEVTAVDVSKLGHGYYAESRTLLTDMHAVLVHNHRPNMRMGLEAVTTAVGEQYWRLRP